MYTFHPCLGSCCVCVFGVAIASFFQERADSRGRGVSAVGAFPAGVDIHAWFWTSFLDSEMHLPDTGLGLYQMLLLFFC